MRKKNCANAPEYAMRSERLARLQNEIGHSFSDMQILRTALCHSSYANENGVESNERLEFLGDAVLELCVSSELFRRFPKAREGDLTEMRAGIVNSARLSQKAGELGLGDALLLGRGEERQGGRQKQNILEDAFEAMLGAVYLDAGFGSARRVVESLFADIWPNSSSSERKKDSKTLLQEISQKLFGGFPSYRQTSCVGPEHAKMFEVALVLPDGREFLASGGSCKRAEHAAAAMALQELARMPESSTNISAHSDD